MRAIQPSVSDAKSVLYEGALNEGAMAWLTRLGAIGFLFFLIKGLLWLILPFLLMQFGVQI